MKYGFQAVRFGVSRKIFAVILYAEIWPLSDDKGTKNGVHAVTQLVEALRYKPEGRGFDSRWCHWSFPLTYSFQPHYGPGVHSASNRNEYQEYFLGVKAAGA